MAKLLSKKKLRGRDLNPRLSGYEPDTLPDCATPHQWTKLGSNQRPEACKAPALPTELLAHTVNLSAPHLAVFLCPGFLRCEEDAELGPGLSRCSHIANRGDTLDCVFGPELHCTFLTDSKPQDPGRCQEKTEMREPGFEPGTAELITLSALPN